MKKLLKVLVFAIIALGVAAAVWLGIIDPKRVKAEARNLTYDARRVAADLASGPSGPSSGAQQSASQCRHNLSRLETAKRAVNSRGGFATGTVSWDAVLSEIREWGGRRPVCPSGGGYSLNSLEMLPTCSVSANGTIETADDHIIKR